MIPFCHYCGNEEEVHAGMYAENAKTVEMIEEIIASLPDNAYSETLTAVLVDWKTHTLPACDPLAID